MYVDTHIYQCSNMAMDNPQVKNRWRFGTFFIVPNSWDDDPIGLIFFRGVGQPPTRLLLPIINHIITIIISHYFIINHQPAIIFRITIRIPSSIDGPFSFQLHGAGDAFHRLRRVVFLAWWDHLAIKICFFFSPMSEHWGIQVNMGI